MEVTTPMTTTLSNPVPTTLVPLTEPPFKRLPSVLPDRSAQLVVTPHPLTTQGQTSVAVLMQDGETLLAVLQRHGVTDTWIVEVGGLQVPALMWGRTRVHHAQVIECRQAVQKEVVKIFALAALAYFTMGAGGFAAGALGGATWGIGTFAATMLGVAAFAVGAMVINKLLPPPKRGGMDMAVNTTEPTYSLSGGRNQMRIWQPMSLVLGQPYVVPDLAGQPYTYFFGEDQYLAQQFHAGINCHAVSNLRIGQTGIEDYQNTTLSAYNLPGSGLQTGLPANSVDTIAGGLLDAPSGNGPWVQRTTSPNTLQIGIDIEANIFGVNTGDGAYVSRDVLLEVQYAVAGSNNWVGVATGSTYRESFQVATQGWLSSGGVDASDYWGTYYTTAWRDVAYAQGTAKLTNASTKPLRVAYNIYVPAGQYDVRLRKLTANETSTSAQNAVQWAQLKSFQQDLGSYPGQSIVALTVKASGQLNGAVDELNWIATAKPMPYWNGSAWTTATSRTNGLSNPGAQILQLARGIFDENGKLIAGLGWPDSRIDVEGLKRFMVWCAAKGLKFDAIIQDAMSHEDLMGAIAYAGLATISWAEGRLGVQWLDDAAPVEGAINMGNIKARSFSVSYDTNDRADEIEYGYFDRARGNAWNSLRVTAPGVTSPRTTARLSNMGITTEAHAALLARHAMAQNIYMAKSITFEQDMEFLTYRRGTVLALSHDMTQWGYSGRIQQATESGGIVTFTLDDTIPATGPGGASSRYIGLRLVGETQYRVFTIAAFTGSTRTVQLAGAWPAGVALPGSNGQPLDALWIYDFKATPGQRVVVAKIEPSDNLAGARVTVVPLPDEFWPYVSSGAYTPPPNISLLGRVPNVTNAQVTEILKRQGNTFYTELTVSFDLSQNTGTTQVWGAVNGAPLQLMSTTPSRSFTWTAGLSETWDIELRPFNLLGQVGGKGRVSYAVQGLTAPPPDVINFTINGTVLSWTGVDAIDLAGYRIRFNYGQNTWWSAATPLHDGLITETPFDLVTRPSGQVTIMIKAVDTTGNESVHTANIVTDLGDALVSNIIATYDQHSTWPGTKTAAYVLGGKLYADDLDAFFGMADQPFFGPSTAVFFDPSQSAPLQYQFTVTAPSPGDLVLQYDFDVNGYTIEYRTVNTGPFYGVGGALFFEAKTDMFFGPVADWSPWPGRLSVRRGEWTEFRINTTGGVGIDVLNTLSAVLDVQDINININDAAISATGTRLPLGQEVNVVKNVQVTVQGSGSGGITARIVDKSPTLGPLIQVLNEAGAPVTGLVDAVIQAY